MSNFNAVRTELRFSEDRAEKPVLARLGGLAAIALLIVAAVAGLAEIHLLPTFSADDFGSILFGAG